MSIVIVDDSKSQRLLLTSMMKSAGFANLIEADSAASVFDLLGLTRDAPQARDIDLILMDISMPEINGIDACRRIKENNVLHDIPIIMVTASTELDDLQLAFDAGAMDYITKPPNKVELLARVRSALRLKMATDARKAREQQLIEYLEQVTHVTDAAAAVETHTFDPVTLDLVGARTDELGKLARVFQRMAREVFEREQRLIGQVEQLSIEINQARKAHEVAAITETEYFQELQKKAQGFRGKPGARP
jgi:DNA-binding response OmpR family regulator